MLEFVRHPERVKPIVLSEDRRRRVEEWVRAEIHAARSERTDWERQWKENHSIHEAEARLGSRRHKAIPNAPSVELPIARMATVEITARMLSIIRAQPKLLEVHTVDKSHAGHAAALQDFVDWGILGPWGLEEALEESPKICVKHGLGMLYMPWTRRVSKTSAYRIISEGPQILPVPVEDCLFRAKGGGRLQNLRWISVVNRYDREEIRFQAQSRGWSDKDIGAASTSSVADTPSRQARRKTSKSVDSCSGGGQYVIHEIYGWIDVDDDGIPEHVLLDWDEGSGRCLRARWNPFDSVPLAAMSFNRHEFSLYGAGIPELLERFQTSTSDFLSWGMTNSLLSNTKAFQRAPGTTGPTNKRVSLFPGSVIDEGLVPFQIADIYPSNLMFINLLLSLAGRMVGLNNFAQPGLNPNLGTRTPVGTAMSVLQTGNDRFGPDYESVKRAIGNAAFQCVLRYREQFLLGNPAAKADIQHAVEGERAGLILELFKEPDFARMVDVSVAAATASDNRALDRDRAAVLAQELDRYADKILPLVNAMVNPQVPEAFKKAVMMIVEARGEATKRLLRAYDEKDPEAFVLAVDEVAAFAASAAPPQAMGMPLGMEEAGSQPDIAALLQAMGQGQTMQ